MNNYKVLPRRIPDWVSPAGLSSRAFKGLFRTYGIFTKKHFDDWCVTAQPLDLESIRSVGESTKRVIAAAIEKRTGRADIKDWFIRRASGRTKSKSYSSYLGEVYIMHSARMGLYKIGFSADSTIRLKQIQRLVFDATLIRTIKGTGSLERSAHAKLRKYKVSGEWFDAPIEIISCVFDELENVA